MSIGQSTSAGGSTSYDVTYSAVNTYDWTCTATDADNPGVVLGQAQAPVGVTAGEIPI